MDLRHYDRIKLDLADLLRAALAGPIAPDAAAQARALLVRLAEDRFNLVMVGRFSRGKTSLMNAMLRTDRLPTGVVPVTSVITTVAYGSTEKVVLYYQHTSLFLDIPIAQLADHITETGNPGNRRRIRTAEVQLPAELLRRGVQFIDTPGLGSSIVENTRTTEAFLPEADAVVLVTSFDSPLSEEELRTLQEVHASGRRVFIIVNKQDLADAAQRQMVTAHLHARLHAVFGDALPPLFAISARQASEARQRNDMVRLAASGLPAFEAALLDFLVNDRRRAFLLRMCDRIAAILRDLPGADDALQRLAALHGGIDRLPAVASPADAPAAAIAATLPACEVCARVTAATFDFIARYQNQLRADARAQQDLAARHGLCGPHTAWFEAVAAPTEVCSGFATLMERQAAHLRAASHGDPSGALACDAVAAALPTVESCPACAVARAAEQAEIDAVAKRLARDPAGALDRLSAICLPHLRPLLDALGSPPLVKAVLLRQADLLDRLAEDMRRFVLKRDAARRDLASQEEASAADRALRVLAGHPRAQLGPPAPSDQGAVHGRPGRSAA